MKKKTRLTRRERLAAERAALPDGRAEGGQGTTRPLPASGAESVRAGGLPGRGALALGFLVVVCYLPALGAGFVWDDVIFTEASRTKGTTGLSLYELLAGAQAVGAGPARLPRGQRAAAPRQRAAGVAPDAAPGGARGLDHRGGLRRPPPACRVGRLGHRAQGPALRAVLPDRRADLDAVRRGAGPGTLPAGARSVHWRVCCPSPSSSPCPRPFSSGTGGEPAV